MKIDVSKQTIDIIFAYENERRRDEMCNGIIGIYRVVLVGFAHSYSYFHLLEDDC